MCGNEASNMSFLHLLYYLEFFFALVLVHLYIAVLNLFVPLASSAEKGTWFLVLVPPPVEYVDVLGGDLMADTSTDSTNSWMRGGKEGWRGSETTSSCL